MKFNNSLLKYKKIIYLIARNIFLVYVILLLINISQLFSVGLYLNLDLLFVVVLLINTLALAIRFSPEKEKTVPAVSKEKEFLSYVLLFCLFLIAFSQILSYFDNLWCQKIIEIYNLIQNKLVIFTIVIVTLVFYLNRAESKIKIAKEKIGQFPQKFPKINKIPIVRNFAAWIYQEKWWYVSLILGILVLFLLVKLPYLDNSIIESPNYSKFTSYLPNLITAYQHKNVFYNQNLFYQNLNAFNNQSYPYSSFPFYTWTFLPFMPLTKYIPFLLLVRILMAVLDALILFLCYLFFKKVFGKKIALCGLLLLAVNPFFHQYFFVTVMDRPALIFLFLGLIVYLSNKKLLAYLFCGLSALMKESFFLLSFPFLIFLILFKKKENKNEKLLNLVNLTILGFLPYLIFAFFIKKTPTYSFPFNIFILGTGIFIASLIYFFLKKEKTQKYLMKMLVQNKILLTFPFVFLGLTFLLFHKKIITSMGNFLPDFSILFQWKMYYLIVRQTEIFFPEGIWILVFLGFLGMMIYKKRYAVSLPFIFSIVSYIVIASKGVFFHYYYRHIIVIFFVFLFCYFLFTMSHFLKRKYLNFVIILFVLLKFATASYTFYLNQAETLSKSDSTTGYTETATYLQEIVKPDEKIIAPSYPLQSGLILLAFRAPANFNNSIREEITKLGFSKTMQKYNVRYYVSKGESDFQDILNLFEKISTSTMVTRSEHILHRISDECRKKYPDNMLVDLRGEFDTTTILVDINQVLNKCKPSQYFKLKKIIGDFYVYEII